MKFGKYIFIHIPKNMGHSIENILIENGLEYELDVKFSIIKLSLKFIHNIYNNSIMYYVCYFAITLLFFLKDKFMNLPYAYHTTYNQYKKKYKTEDNKYFTIIRHPQGRLESYYKFMYSNVISFERFVKEVCDDSYKFSLMPNIDKYNLQSNYDYLGDDIDNKILTIKYENIKDEFPNLCSFLGIDSNTQIKHFNKSKETKLIYTKEMAKLVYDKYKCDYKKYDYKIYYEKKNKK